MEKQGYVYIVCNTHNNVLYVGVTSDLGQRIHEHRIGAVKGFTKKYKCRKLVYYEVAPDMEAAITREKQLKGGSRAKKIALIEGKNPSWEDLSKFISA